MKSIKLIIIACLLVELFYKADAQDGYGMPTQNSPQQFEPEPNSLGAGEYLEIGFGYAIPTGVFSNTVGAGYTGGYAMPGKTINLSLGTPIAHSRIGIILMYGYYNNVFDLNTYVYNIQKSDQSKSYNPLLQDSYTENLIMVGLIRTWPVQRFSFDMHITAGVAFCSLPEILYDAETSALGYAYQWYYYPTTSRAFAYDIGGNVQYRVHHTLIMVGVNFIHTKPVLNTTLDYSNPVGAVRISQISGSIPISDISINLGIGYQLTGK